MIGRLNHVAIAVPSLAAAAAQYRAILGAEVSEAVPQPEHGVTVVFVVLPNTKVELLEPLGASSPIAGFLERNPAGGIHHLCYEVADIRAARDRLKASFYEGELWTQELEAVLMPMIDRYDVVLVEDPEGWVQWR